MASSRLDEEEIRYEVNGPTSSHCRISPSQSSGQLGGANIENLCDVNATTTPIVEFAVNLNDHNDLRKLDDALKRRGVKMLSSNLDDKTIHVQFSSDRHAGRPHVDVQSLQKYVEQETGFLAVIKGMGDLSAAVAELRPAPSSNRSMFGVVRMSQMTNGACFVDGLIDESNEPIHSHLTHQHEPCEPDSKDHRLRLAIHEFGDLSSDNYDSIGEPAIEIVQKESSGLPASMSLQRIVPQCDVTQLIGKSMALSLLRKDAADQPGEILSAGVIARASTISANRKQVCACSGKTLWEERAERQTRH